MNVRAYQRILFGVAPLRRNKVDRGIEKREYAISDLIANIARTKRAAAPNKILRYAI